MTNDARISPAEAHEKMTNDGYTYVDVRTQDEFAAGHPEGAVNVPLMFATAEGMQPNEDFVRVVEARFEKSAPLVVGCKMGGRSARAAKALVAAGFTNVLDQRAGWDGSRGTFGELLEPGWARAGLPQETGNPEGRAYADMLRSTRG